MTDPEKVVRNQIKLWKRVNGNRQPLPAQFPVLPSDLGISMAISAWRNMNYGGFTRAEMAEMFRALVNPVDAEKEAGLAIIRLKKAGAIEYNRGRRRWVWIDRLAPENGE